jgi:paraquat-inducible protein B
VTLPLPPEMQIDPPRQSRFRNLSFVWLVPVLALVVTFGVAWKSYSDRGTLIAITFPTAEGVTPGETVLKFREVVIGTIEDVKFGADFQTVTVFARIDNDLALTLPPDALFWIVRPVVSARGISGLSTVLSGVYIEGAWQPTKEAVADAFFGLAKAPIVRPGRAGTRIILRSAEGSLLPEGGPIFFRGVEVGQIDVPRVSENGESATVEAFINAPHDRFVTTATRFWDMSGFSVKVGPGGLDLSVASLGSLLSGGVAFDNTFSGGKPLTDNTIFNLYLDEDSARNSIYTEISENALPLAIIFTGSVNGLASGAPIEYRGLRVGQVTGINAFIERTPSGDRVVRLRTAIVIDPQALGLGSETGRTEMLTFLHAAVAQGLRARLTTTSIFSAALKIELVELPDEPPAAIRMDADDIPLLPNVTSDLPDFTATAEGVLKRINALPVEDLMNQAVTLMASIEAVVGSEGVRQTPEALVKLLEDSRAFLNNDDTQALPSELRGAVADLRQVVTDLQDRGAVEKLVSILEEADKAAANLATASADFPDLVADLRDLAAKAKGLKAEDLVASTTALLDSATALIGTDAARALPGDLSKALAEVQTALADLREGGAITSINEALASANDAAQSVAAATDDLPKLTAELEDLVAKASGLIATYGSGSTFSKETAALLRELQATAKSVTQLARTIERNPNSLLIGR